MQLPALAAKTADVYGAFQQGQNDALRQKVTNFKLQQAQQEAQRQAQFGQYVPGILSGDQGAIAGAAQTDPDKLIKLLQIPKAQRDRAKAQVDQIGKMLLAVENSPGVQRPQMYQQVRQQAEQAGMDLSNVPPTYNQAWVRTTIAQAGQYRSILDQADKAKAPAGYRFKADGSLEAIGGGPADPAQARRLAEARSLGEGVTPTQQANNAEIDAARRALKSQAPTPDDLERMTAPSTATGRVNNDYKESLAQIARRAFQRKVGEDPEFERLYRRYYGAVPPEIPEAQGMGELSSYGPGPRPTPPIPKRRPEDIAPGSPTRPPVSSLPPVSESTRQRDGSMTLEQKTRKTRIPQMEIDQIRSLLDRRDVILDDQDRQLIDQRLHELGR